MQQKTITDETLRVGVDVLAEKDPDLYEVRARLGYPPTSDEQLAIAENWTPWRAVAARMLWMHYLDARGQ